MTREDAYPIVVPYLWCSAEKPKWQTGAPMRCYFNTPNNHPGWCGPFRWSPVKPPPEPGQWNSLPAGQDFPNPHYMWAHPDYQTYMAGYAYWDRLKAEEKRASKTEVHPGPFSVIRDVLAVFCGIKE